MKRKLQYLVEEYLRPYLFPVAFCCLMLFAAYSCGYIVAANGSSNTCKEFGYFTGSDGLYWCMSLPDAEKLRLEMDKELQKQNRK
jgi:hypothetical protein